MVHVVMTVCCRVRFSNPSFPSLGLHSSSAKSQARPSTTKHNPLPKTLDPTHRNARHVGPWRADHRNPVRSVLDRSVAIDSVDQTIIMPDIRTGNSNSDIQTPAQSLTQSRRNDIPLPRRRPRPPRHRHLVPPAAPPVVAHVPLRAPHHAQPGGRHAAVARLHGAAAARSGQTLGGFRLRGWTDDRHRTFYMDGYGDYERGVVFAVGEGWGFIIEGECCCFF